MRTHQIVVSAGRTACGRKVTDRTSRPGGLEASDLPGLHSRATARPNPRLPAAGRAKRTGSPFRPDTAPGRRRFAVRSPERFCSWAASVQKPGNPRGNQRRRCLLQTPRH